MSKELEKLEKKAKQKYITENKDIEKIIRYLFTRPFSSFQGCGATYEYLLDDLCKGFNIFKYDINKITLEDVLILIGYEPGNSYFNPPDRRKMEFSSRFNAAGHSYVFAELLAWLAHKDTHIKEFTRITLDAYTDYIRDKIEEEYKDKLILFTAYSDILQKVGEFKKRSGEYVRRGRQKGSVTEKPITLWDLISNALIRSGRGWSCTVYPLDKYCFEIIESYDMLNRFIMDSLRMPLIRSDRERFQEIITKYRDRFEGAPVNIDYEKCYEHCGIILK